MPRGPVHERLLSPITRRILAVNILALALLAGGILFLGEYRRGLIEAELDSMFTHAEMVAGALAEGAVAPQTPGTQSFVRESARQMLHRMVETSHSRARLFGPDGTLLVDSRYIAGLVESEELTPPDDSAVTGALSGVYSGTLAWLSGKEAIPRYEEYSIQHGSHYEESMAALEGDRAAMVRKLGSGVLLLSVAVPVQRYKVVLGAVMLSKDSREIDAAVLDVRIDILKVFAVTLTVTFMLSVYLAGTIARPLNRLAAAADLVRHGAHRQHRIPDLSRRRDEIGDLSSALSDMTEALWRRMDAIEQFAADVSHEIKNPLTSLRSAVETAARIDDPASREKLMEVIQQDVERLDRLISDISDASRLDSELSRAETAPLEISALVAGLVDVNEATRREDAPRITFRLEGDAPVMVEGIEGRLVQVFRNLFSNAASFSPPGGEVSVCMVADRKAKVVKITVDDNGPGLPESREDRIFDRFYSERPTGEAFGKHSGLGLSISRQIMETHGGDITGENRRDADGAVTGARFTVRLPLLPPSAGKRKKPDK
ncbi:MAG: sensor histidine kinase [Rhodospirillales bacterium]|nr:sensor histidine kinase [Rhodospirillales bacterium]